MESPRLQNATNWGGIPRPNSARARHECNRRELVRLGPPERRVCIELLTRSNRRNLPQATWDRLLRLLLGRELDRLDAFLRSLSVNVTRSLDASTTQHFGRSPHLFKKGPATAGCLEFQWSSSQANIRAVADHLFPPVHMHMVALYAVWYNSATLWSMADLAEMIDASLPECWSARAVQKSGLAVGAISFETLLAFAATCLVIELAPGPNMAYLAVLSASKGRRAGFAATLGIALGLLIVGLAAALGLTAIITNSRWVYEALRWGGVFYLLWLAWEGWRRQEKTSPGNADLTAHDSRFFVRGLVTNLINPKAGIFYVAVLPAFLDEARPLVGQAVTLSAIYVAVATAAHSTIVLLADAARPWLEDERRSTIVRRALSLMLAGIAVWLFVATRYVA